MGDYYQRTTALLRDPTIREVSLGISTIRLLRPEELKKGQLGYALGTEGEDLTGDEPGMWQRSWVVIAYDEAAGDPIFVDAAADRFPVYWFMHDWGELEPEFIAPSFDAFMEILQELKPITRGREHPVGLAENPITQKERSDFIEFVKVKCDGELPIYWEVLVRDLDDQSAYDFRS
jgi:hypothetical protein